MRKNCASGEVTEVFGPNLEWTRPSNATLERGSRGGSAMAMIRERHGRG